MLRDARQSQATVKCGKVALRLTLNEKLLGKPFAAAVLEPFLAAYVKKTSIGLKADDLTSVTVDGAPVTWHASALAGDLLPGASHKVVLKPSEPSASDAAVERAKQRAWTSAAASSSAASNSAASSSAASSAAASSAASSDPVERVLRAPHEFAVLELPLAPASPTAVRKAYRQATLLVHPDKVSHKSAPEAFRRCFDAMKLLLDEKRQAARLRQLQAGSSTVDEAGIPPEARWWESASVQEMEQAFHNLEEYLEAQGALAKGARDLDDALWVEPPAAERRRLDGLASGGCVSPTLEPRTSGMCCTAIRLPSDRPLAAL